ncbi:iron-containing alcohol dehydrogenase [Candidatus Spongiihabitans sp.]|uniref:iron-containing alcohol dehydrogenase n=1 Tax=Candidatus Spongiihabitans sp. TaxID=3101308 RepID=UPI003C70103F
MNANWHYPTAMRVGVGRIAEIAEVCALHKITAPLLVTDPGVAALPMVRNVVDICTAAGLGIQVFSDIKPNPTGANVERGIAVYKKGKHDGVIAFGGGSGIDAGKAIAVAAEQQCSMWDLEDIGDNWLRAEASKIPPIIAVPTTAGTGSEVGRAAVIVNQQQHRKVIIFHPRMSPDCVILDPELTIGLPAQLTAATGMDALSHSLEAFCSPLFHPMAEGIAIEGIRLVKEYLPIAVANGSNIAARTQMLAASSMGATAFQKGLGAMHALAHPLGARYDAHHGTLNAVLMPYVLIANRDVIKQPITRLGRYLDIGSGFEPFLDWVLELRESINIPNTLQDIGIDDNRLDEIGEMAVADPSAATNPIDHNADTYAKIAANAVHGRL